MNNITKEEVYENQSTSFVLSIAGVLLSITAAWDANRVSATQTQRQGIKKAQTR